MKIYSTYHRKDIRVSNTMKTEQNVDEKPIRIRTKTEKLRRSTTESEKSDSWLSYVAKRMQIVRDRVSEFFLVETID